MNMWDDEERWDDTFLVRERKRRKREYRKKLEEADRKSFEEMHEVYVKLLIKWIPIAMVIGLVLAAYQFYTNSILPPIMEAVDYVKGVYAGFMKMIEPVLDTYGAVLDAFGAVLVALDPVLAPVKQWAGPPAGFVGGHVERLSAPYLEWFLLGSLAPVAALVLVAATGAVFIKHEAHGYRSSGDWLKGGFVTISANILGVAGFAIFITLLLRLLAWSDTLFSGLQYVVISLPVLLVILYGLAFIGGFVASFFYHSALWIFTRFSTRRKPESEPSASAGSTATDKAEPAATDDAEPASYSFRDRMNHGGGLIAVYILVFIPHLTGIKEVSVLESLIRIWTLFVVAAIVFQVMSMATVLATKPIPKPVMNILFYPWLLSCLAVFIWWVAAF